MTIWAVVPVKDFVDGKQRLASALSPAERARLCRAMLEDVLTALSAAQGLVGIAVVTRDADAAAIARRFGARCLAEPTNDGQSVAVGRAVRGLMAAGATGVLQLPGDVPGARADALTVALGAHRGVPAVTIVPAHDGRGSNCLICSPPDVIPFHFGHDSFLPHCAAAREAGITPTIVRDSTIALDIDTSDDLRAFIADPSTGRTLDYLQTSGVAARITDPSLLPQSAVGVP